MWQLTDEWNKAWEKYKSGEFWKIETEEMELTAQTLFRKLTRLSRELKDKGYRLVEELLLVNGFCWQLGDRGPHEIASGRLPQNSSADWRFEKSVDASKTLGACA